MKALIAEFGTDHYYQADGFFNAAKGPWLADNNPDAQAHTKQLAPSPPDPVAAAHSAAAYAGMARTDPKSVWVYQTWMCVSTHAFSLAVDNCCARN